jgi:hypothetical protein
MHVKENSFQFQFVIIQSLGLVGQKTNSRKHGFLSSPTLKKTFHYFGIHLVTFENQQFLSLVHLC